MKTENTPENVQRFRALYVNQDVYLENWKRCQTTLNCAPMNLWPDDDGCDILVLKPLSAISDEDAIEVAIISGIKREDILTIDQSEGEPVVDRSAEFEDFVSVKYWHESVGETTEWESRDFNIFLKNGDVSDSYGCANNISAIVDFLRSKGYLIGWMDLTPEDILAYGWARLEGEG